MSGGQSLRFEAPSLGDIEDAQRQIASEAVRTPLLLSRELAQASGAARVYVKAECLQRTGSFKFRGAHNLISRLSADQCAIGVAAYSSGNHAQAVAEAARIRGAPALIVMPSDAPAAKIAGVRARGGEVVLYDRLKEDREAICRALAAERGFALCPPFEHPLIVAGQGTCGLEIAQDIKAKGEEIDLAIVCASGGGLIAGIATALQGHFTDCRLYAAEPESHDDIARSLDAGQIVANAPGARSIADALLSPSPGAFTFSIHQKRLSGGFAVSDEALLDAMAFAFKHLKLVLEPGGAAALAAALARPAAIQGKRIALIASGGNVDAPMFRRALDRL